jgi:putative ABC transport system substrate-binding protein
MGRCMNRRDTIALIVSAAGSSLVARAQQPDRMRKIGILMGLSADNPVGQARVATFRAALQQLGWAEGREVRIELRWGGPGDGNLMQTQATELVALAPDIIVANGSPALAPLLQATRSIPIVFTIVADPVGAGFVDSLARPGGNATGFLTFDYSISVKWLELLKDIAPSVTRAGVLRDPTLTFGTAQFAAIQAVAPTLRMEVSPLGVREAGEIERGITAFARTANGGLIVTASAFAQEHRQLIITLAARQKLPAIYYERVYVEDGGLLSYGPSYIDQYRLAASYVDRILKGEKPTDLPVQAPTKYELLINLNTAKTLGLTIPTTLLARADEMIE